MNREDNISKIEFAIIYFLFGIMLLFQYSRSFSQEESFLFIELIMTYVWTAGLIVYAKIRYNLHMFEPITMISVIYEGIFVLKPIIDLRSNSMTEHGISVIGGGPKATFLFGLGFTIFFFSYYVNHRRLVYNGHSLFHVFSKEEELHENQLKWLYSAWIIVYALCIYCMLTQGLSLKYIFSFGTEGVRSIDESNTALLFLSNFGITLVTLWLMIWEYSNNKLIKIITTFFCTIYILMRNARWLMLVFIISPIVLFYLKRNKQPRILWLTLIGIGGLTIFAWMQANRAILASGGSMQGWGTDGFSLEKLLAPLETDLSTYRTFYSMVKRYPSQYSYMLGTTFLYSFVLFIPRAIWSGKPDNPIRDVIEHSLNRRARVSGTAVANIGEFYANFGMGGILVFMYLLGWITASLKKYIFQKESMQLEFRNRYILYAILYPLFFQWIARGNFSGNLYITIFAFLPVIFLRIVSNIGGKE